MIFGLFFCLALTSFSAGAIQVQQTPAPRLPPPTSSSETNSGEPEQSRMGSLRDEMEARNEIRQIENSHRENLDRARENATIATALRTSYARNHALSREERRQLERMERLSRRIRNEAGGSDSNEPLNNPPQNLEPALERIKTLSESIRVGVENTSRFSISVDVINRSNELLELLRFVRNMTQ